MSIAKLGLFYIINSIFILLLNLDLVVCFESFL